LLGPAKIKSILQLELEQVANHLAARHPRRRPQSREIQCRRECVGVSEEKHGRDPAARVLEREAALGHLVLLDGAADEVVHRPGRVDLGVVLAGRVGPLLTRQDVEVVISRVAASVSLGSNGSAKDDQIFSNAYICLMSVIRSLYDRIRPKDK
jgi:hypothetical protein